MTLTKDQIKWLNHFSDTKLISIIPWDPTAQEKFEKVKDKIQNKLGQNIVVEHHGATSLGISGQDEIDVYVPVSPDKFNEMIKPLSLIFGEPVTNYPLNRVRFVTNVEGKHVDIHMVNSTHPNWLNGIKFEEYLKENPESMEEYRQLK